MRRSSTSIGANIAEGRKGDCERPIFPDRNGAGSELEYNLLLARDLHMLDAVDYQRLASETVEVKRMLASFICKLKAES
jgi:four helix bundle protein